MSRIHPIWKYKDDRFTQLCLWCNTEIDHCKSNTCEKKECKNKKFIIKGGSCE